MKLFEYLATGVPLVSTRVGSIAEILDERVAFLFDPDDPASLSSAVAAVLADPAAARRRAVNGVELIRSEYTWAKRAEGIVAFLGLRPEGEPESAASPAHGLAQAG